MLRLYCAADALRPANNSGSVVVRLAILPTFKRQEGRMAAKTKGTRARKGTAATNESKKDIVLRLLRRQNGASLAEITEATSWQEHSVRGFLTATIRKKL